MRVIQFLKYLIYDQKLIRELVKENIRLNRQLTEANEVAMFYSAMQDKAIEAPVTLVNFNKAVGYCHKYCLPTAR